MKWCIPLPEETILVVRPSFNAICWGVKPAAKLLGTLLYRYSIRAEHQSEAQNMNEVKRAIGEEATQDTTCTIYRKQSQLVADMCDEVTEKTLHDTAVPALQLLGYLDLEEHMQCNSYTLHIDRIEAALQVYKDDRGQLENFLISSLQLEKFLISTDKGPDRLEKVLIDKKYFLSRLEKVLIWNRNISYYHRGRKPSPEERGRGKKKNPKISIEITKKITKKITSKESTYGADALASHRAHTQYENDSHHAEQRRPDDHVATSRWKSGDVPCGDSDGDTGVLHSPTADKQADNNSYSPTRQQGREKIGDVNDTLDRLTAHGAERDDSVRVRDTPADSKRTAPAQFPAVSQTTVDRPIPPGSGAIDGPLPAVPGQRRHSGSTDRRTQEHSHGSQGDQERASEPQQQTAAPRRDVHRKGSSSPTAHQQQTSTEALATPDQTGGKATEVGGKTRKEPTPIDAQMEMEMRRRHWQHYINERRGGALRTQGLCINETECLKKLVAEFTDEQITAIDKYLATEHWKYKRNPAEIGGKALLDESRPSWALLKDRVKPTTQPVSLAAQAAAKARNQETLARVRRMVAEKQVKAAPQVAYGG